MLQHRSNATLAVMLTIVSLWVGGCDKSDPPSPVPAPQPERGMSTRWVPNPSVDLMSPEGTFIRAFVESRKAATLSTEHTGLKAIESDGFPGFAHALNGVEPPEQIGGIYPDFGRWGAGTWYYEIIELQTQPAGRAAVICEMMSMIADRVDGGDDYESRGSDGLGHAWRLTFTPDPTLPPGQQQSPAANQHGPAKRPAENVFGTWIATDYEYLGTEPAVCNRLAPGTPTDWPNPYYRKDPPPTLSPEPGWPAGSPA